jgi:hypothetical protein
LRNPPDAHHVTAAARTSRSRGHRSDSLARNRRVDQVAGGARRRRKNGASSPRSGIRATTGVSAGGGVPQRALPRRGRRRAAALEPEIDIATLELQLAILQPSDGLSARADDPRRCRALAGQQVRLTSTAGLSANSTRRTD